MGLLHRGSGKFKGDERHDDNDSEPARELHELNKKRKYPPLARAPVAIFGIVHRRGQTQDPRQKVLEHVASLTSRLLHPFLCCPRETPL